MPPTLQGKQDSRGHFLPVEIRVMLSDAESLSLRYHSVSSVSSDEDGHIACQSHLSVSLSLIFRAHATERGPLGGPCGLRDFICERRKKRHTLQSQKKCGLQMR